MADKIKRNALRFFYPNEWYSFRAEVTNPKHSFIFNLLINTGLRIAEARALKIGDIDLERKFMLIRKGKGNKQRQVSFSSNFRAELIQHIKANKLDKDSTLSIPSTQFMDKAIKNYASKAKLSNPQDFSCHTFRKTHENYLCARGVNTMLITLHMGHTVGVAQTYYVSQFLKPEEKGQIRSIIGDLFEVDNSSPIINQT